MSTLALKFNVFRMTITWQSLLKMQKKLCHLSWWYVVVLMYHVFTNVSDKEFKTIMGQ